MNELTLYVANNCHDCSKVLDFVKANHPTITVFNFDTENITPPFDLYAFPALLQGKELKAYGLDVIKYLNTYV